MFICVEIIGKKLQNLQKLSAWKPLFPLNSNEDPLESVQPSSLRYSRLPDDWIVELRISLEREIKLRFDEARKHGIPQWNLVAARQLRESLETSPDTVEEKMGRLREGYSITVVVLRIDYSSMEECVKEVLATRLHDSPDQNTQFGLAVHVVDFFAHVIQIDLALAALKPKR
uniref:ACT domain-containing protein n=1 Tax=Caenorhabditis tropicalis TaxID=1561998 RepID=A0A1I7U4I0_9PELO